MGIDTSNPARSLAKALAQVAPDLTTVRAAAGDSNIELRAVDLGQDSFTNWSTVLRVASEQGTDKRDEFLRHVEDVYGATATVRTALTALRRDRSFEGLSIACARLDDLRRDFWGPQPVAQGTLDDIGTEIRELYELERVGTEARRAVSPSAAFVLDSRQADAPRSRLDACLGALQVYLDIIELDHAVRPAASFGGVPLLSSSADAQAIIQVKREAATARRNLEDALRSLASLRYDLPRDRA